VSDKNKLRVGVIGGGQLARMMIVPAINLGLDIKVLAEAEDSSAALAATMVGDYTQFDVVQEFAKTVDVITFDHEHVPLEILQKLEAKGVNVQPPSKALAFAQNKLHMRRQLSALNLPMPEWAAVTSAEELDQFIADHSGVAILKTPIGGYDGKGVRVVRSSDEASDWLTPEALAGFGGELLVEEKVEFVREVAQLSARNPSGEFKAWPLVQTTQSNGVCAEVLAPAPGTTPALLELSVAIAAHVAEGLGVTGVLAVEMFQSTDARLLINELAMRPHNSGHFSIEGSVTSQFEQHLRAVLDLPLGETEMTAPYAIMVNLLGVDNKNTFVGQYRKAMAAHPTVKIHTYGKSARSGRKMGHVTAVGQIESAIASEVWQTVGILLCG
jgi:5-(carboxyamino)imidazole ribonucleotide synthase